jgi:hypothetical protein
VNGELPAARRGGARCCYPPVRVPRPHSVVSSDWVTRIPAVGEMHAPGAGGQRANERGDEPCCVVAAGDSEWLDS